jgi:hypothetical protein
MALRQLNHCWRWQPALPRVPNLFPSPGPATSTPVCASEEWLVLPVRVCLVRCYAVAPQAPANRQLCWRRGLSKYTSTAFFDGERDPMCVGDVFRESSRPLRSCPFGAEETIFSNASKARIARSICDRCLRSLASPPCLTTIGPLLSQGIMFVIEVPA